MCVNISFPCACLCFSVLCPSLQLDNQLPKAMYPQVLYSIPPPPSIASSLGERVTLHCWLLASVRHCLVQYLTRVNHSYTYSIQHTALPFAYC